MRKFTVTTLLSIFILMSSFISSSVAEQPEIQEITEFAYVPIAEGWQNYNRYLDEIGIQRLSLINRISEDKKSSWYEVVNRNNRVLKRFGTNYSVSYRARGRYRDQAMLLITATLKRCEKNCSTNYLFRSGQASSKVGNLNFEGAFDNLILKNAEYLSINSKGLLFQGSGSRSLASPYPITDGTLGYDIDGNWLAIAVSDDGTIMVADKNGWSVVDLTLAAHGDRSGVLSIFPDGKGGAYIAIYRYTNEYNKGLYVLDYSLDTRKINKQGWLFNSENRNIGFDPGIYLDTTSNQVMVNAKNSSIDNGHVYFRLSPEDWAALQPGLPLHLQDSGFAKEKIGSFMIGGGISQVYWNASSKVEKNDITFSEVEYLIADSLFVSANIEARLGNTSLTLNYLQNEAEDLADSEIDDTVNNSNARTLAKEASRYLFSTIDFHGLLGASSSLRLQLEKGETKGVAEVDITGEEKFYTTFETSYNRYALLAMRERGLYLGGDYVNYNMPSAVGFSNNTANIVFASFDQNFEFSTLRFVIGYDALAYAKRYETNYSRFYWAGGVNVGLGWATLSNETIEQARLETGKSKIADLPLFIALGGELELGYIWQKRSKSLNGLGYSSSVGYKVNGNYLGAGQDEEVDNDDLDSLALEFSRVDIFHGPFFKVNVIF